MLLLAIVILVSMALVNYRLEQKLLYPPVVFCSVWAADLLLVWLVGDLFFPLSDKSLVIFCCGGLSLSLGSCLALLSTERDATTNISAKASNAFLNALVLVVACSGPFVIYSIVELASNLRTASILLAARMATVDAYASGEAPTLLFGLLTLSIIVAMISSLERGRGGKRSFLAIVLALGFNILTGSRAALFGLILSLIAIGWFRNQRIRWKPLILMVLTLTVSFAAIAIYVQNGEVRADASLSENLSPVAELLALYAAGGIVGFDQVVRQPNIIPHNWQITKFFFETANKFGGRFDVPDLHAGYVSVGPHLSGNVYTMYFAYLGMGYVGMMLTVFFIGFIVGLFYRKALQGSKTAILIYSFLFGALLLSPFNENFFMGLNYSTKIFAVCWVVYGLPIRAAQFTALVNWATIAGPTRHVRFHDPEQAQ
jgi:oligosaccharide repeat unit polymerase